MENRCPCALEEARVVTASDGKVEIHVPTEVRSYVGTSVESFVLQYRTNEVM